MTIKLSHENDEMEILQKMKTKKININRLQYSQQNNTKSPLVILKLVNGIQIQPSLHNSLITRPTQIITLCNIIIYEADLTILFDLL